MHPRIQFHKAFLLKVAALVLSAPGLAQAQVAQTATPIILPSGACGQSLGLTHIYMLPVDQVAPEAQVLSMARHEPQFLEFRVTGPITLRLETSSAETDYADSFLTLFDAAGDVLGFDDDSAGNLNALLELSVTPGTYCAQVRMLGEPAQGPVDVTLDFQVIGAGGGGAQIGEIFAGDRTLPCGDPARTRIAGRLAPGFGNLGFDSAVPVGASQDWVIVLAQAMSLRIATGGDEFDTVLTLRDAARRLIAENDDGSDLSRNSLIEETLAAGEYCLSVSGYAETGGNARLEIIETEGLEGGDAGDAGAGGGQIGDGGQIVGGGGQIDGGGSDGGTMGGTGFAAGGPCGDLARTLSLGRIGQGFGNVQTSGTVALNEAQDWILSLADPLDLRLEATSDGIDTLLALYDTGGTLLDENDDGFESGTGSRIVRSLGAGDYCISVQDYFGSDGSFQLAAYEESSGGGSIGGGQIGGGTSAGGAFAANDPCGDPSNTLYLGALGRGFMQSLAQGSVPGNGTSHFAADLNGPLDLTVAARSGAFDTVLSIYDAAGTLIAENDDGVDTGTDSEVVSGFMAGPVCFAVRGFGGVGGPFELAVVEEGGSGGGSGDTGGGGATGGGGISGGGFGDVDRGGEMAGPSGPCGDLAVTADIGSLRAGFGTMSFAMEVAPEGVSNLRFTVEDLPTVRIETMQADFDTILDIYRGAEMIETNDDSIEGGTGSMITAALVPGEYCASVRGFAGEGGQLSLVVSEPGAVREAVLDMPGPDSGIAFADLGTLDAAGLSQNAFAAEGDSWVMFDLAAPITVSVRAINVTGPFSLGLFDAATGAQIDAVAGAGGMVLGEIDAALGAGRYAVGVAPDRAFDAGMRRIEISAE
jgi:hypothetical protein